MKSYEKIENCLRLLGLKARKHEKGDVVCYGFTVGSAFQYDMRVCCSGRLLRVAVRLNAGQSILTRLSTFALTANFFRGETPRDAAVGRESPQIASANAV